jgi:hypothetical protein
MGRASFLLLACWLGMFAALAGRVAESDAFPRGGGPVLGGFADDLSVSGSGAVSFSATVRPHGRATIAYFQYGLDARYREPRPHHVVYDESTPRVHLAAGFARDVVAGTASGLLPNALYHLRLVASSSAGTVYSRDATFTTAPDPAPSAPLTGRTVNVGPISGLVLYRTPRVSSPRTSKVARLVAGTGFLPLTETRQLPAGSQIDARAGALRIAVAGPRRRQLERVSITGGLFTISQIRRGATKSLTTMDLLDGDFAGAPTSRSCVAKPIYPIPGPSARIVHPSSVVLQTLHARAQDGHFRARARYSESTAGRSGAVWDTIERCDGTLTVVHRGTVSVFDRRRRRTVVVHAGSRYLAAAR